MNENHSCFFPISQSSVLVIHDLRMSTSSAGTIDATTIELMPKRSWWPSTMHMFSVFNTYLTDACEIMYNDHATLRFWTCDHIVVVEVVEVVYLVISPFRSDSNGWIINAVKNAHTVSQWRSPTVTTNNEPKTTIQKLARISANTSVPFTQNWFRCSANASERLQMIADNCEA